MKTITYEQASVIANAALDQISAALKEAGIDHDIQKAKDKLGKYNSADIICYSSKERKVDTRIEISGVKTYDSFSCQTYKFLMVVLPPDGSRKYRDRAERASLPKVMDDLPKLIDTIKDKLAKQEEEQLFMSYAAAKHHAGMKVLATLAPQYVELLHKINVSVPEQYAGPREPQIEIKMKVDASTVAEILRVLNTAVV